MNLNRQEQDTIVEERGKSCFETISDSSYFLLFHFLKFSDVVPAFPKIKKCLHDWKTNVIHNFEHFRSQSLNILMVNTDTSITLLKFLKCSSCIIINCS